MKRQFRLEALKSAFLVSLMLAPLLGASSFSYAVEKNTNQELKADPSKVPYELQNVGLKEHLGEKIDLNLTFTDSADGKKHALKEYFQNGKPTIINLVYFECPMLCTMVLNGVSDGMQGLDWSVGNQFNVLTLSINPKDDVQDAETKRDVYIKNYIAGTTKRNEAQVRDGWHFFTSDEVSIKKLADQLGFEYQYDKEQDQYAHAAVTYVLSPEGMISRNLYGIQYRPRDLRLALLEASRGQVGSIFDRLLMFCYHYEPGKRGYSIMVVRVMQLGGAATVAILGGWLAVFWVRQSRKKVLVERKDTLS